MKVFRNLKKHIPKIIIIVLLVIVQAMCDLSLPTYTSNIINVGVQKQGIDDVSPNVIRQTELNKLLLFINEDDQEFVNNSYKLLSKDTLSTSDYEKYLDKYSTLANENLYIRECDDIDRLDSILGKAILIVSGINNSDDTTKIAGDMAFDIPEGVDVFTYLSSLPKEALLMMRAKIYEKLSELPDIIIEQAAATYVKNEYIVVGLDASSIQTNYIFVAGAKMLLIALISMAATVFVGFFGSRIAAGFAKDLRNQTFGKVLSFSQAEVRKFGTASLITRSTNDIQQIQMFIVMFIRIVVYAPIVAIGAVFKVMSTSQSMTWIIALAVCVILTIVITLFSFGVPKFNKVQKLIDKLNLVTREIITGVPVIRAFSNQSHEEKRFDDANKDLKKVNLFVDRLMSCMMPLMMLVMNGVTLLIVWNGAKGIDAGNIQLGDMIAFIQYTMQIIMAFLMISMVSIILPRAVVSIKRINEVLSEKLSIKDPIKPKNFDLKKLGLVEFKNVSFRYPDANEDVISNINFTANPGETTAFIGSTGSGKSTLINLVPRLFDVTKGEILVDGVNVKDVKQEDLHNIIGYVPQKGVLFSGTIESNIKHGNTTASMKDVIKAAKIAQAEDFIESKRDKYNHEISQGGTNVSGGQKQRLSIARAVCKDPEIFIFDDSFSALDFKTDLKLRTALKKETKDATVLIVAQRVSTIMHADKIVVLDDGKVVGIGTHKELLNTCDVYKEIASSQLTKEEL